MKELNNMTEPQRAEYLAETYADAILRLSYTYLKNTCDAQDICQTVFVKLLTEPRTFDTPEHERAYIPRMAANACKDLLKSPWRKRTCGLEACGEVAAPEADDGSVLSAVNALPPHYRAVIHSIIMRGIRQRRSGRSWGSPQPRCTPVWPGAGTS